MYIVNKNRDCIINIDMTREIFIGKDEKAININFENGNDCQIARYDTKIETKLAIEMIANYMKFGKGNVFYMPDDDEIKTKLIQLKEQYHRSEGKKENHENRFD